MKCDHKVKEMHMEQLNYTRNASLYYEAVGLVELNSFCLLCFFASSLQDYFVLR